MEATATLPRFCMIQSNYNNRYLQLHTTSDVPNIALQFGGGDIFDLSARFEMVPATTRNGLYHIKSIGSNKYLAHLGDGHMWITAVANEPEEDQNSKTCTLFKPVLVYPGGHDNKTIRLRHVKTGNFACLWRVGPPFNECLYTAVPTPDGSGCDVYTIIVESRLAAVDGLIAGLNMDLAKERVDKKALGEKLAASEADVARLKSKETKLMEDKQALEKKVSELASKLEECCGSKDGLNNKYPWMSNTIFPGSWVGFEDLDVLRELTRKSTQITLTEASGAPDLGEDYTTNIRPSHFKRGMLDGHLVCVVVNVAGLLPNYELARFDPNVWGLFSKSGTSYAARKAN